MILSASRFSVYGLVSASSATWIPLLAVSHTSHRRCEIQAVTRVSVVLHMTPTMATYILTTQFYENIGLVGGTRQY